MSYHELSIAERATIQIGLLNRFSQRRIARLLNRSPSTISREIRRNRTTHGHYRFVMGTVTGVDLETRQVRAETLAGLQALSFEHLVLAFGTRTNLALVPGMAKHALPLKLVGDALFIRNRVLQRVARIELKSDPQLRRCLGHFVVVGGGFSGVEVAGELADFLRGALRYYPRVKPDELRGTILQDGARLLPELLEDLGRRAARSLERRGVAVHLGSRAACVDAEGVDLADCGRLAPPRR